MDYNIFTMDYKYSCSGNHVIKTTNWWHAAKVSWQVHSLSVVKGLKIQYFNMHFGTSFTLSSQYTCRWVFLLSHAQGLCIPWC